MPEAFFRQNGDFIFTVLFTTICWLSATLLTSPTKRETLVAFYERVKPDGWWRPFRKGQRGNRQVPYLFVSWLSGVLMVYGVLFFIGYLILEDWWLFYTWLAAAVVGFCAALGNGPGRHALIQPSCRDYRNQP
ncbi:MAG: hypothetical protein U5L96_22380 [Owenweeksia sp.]|nr:hypothetical protein [Owenweeksia sp.]